MSELRRIDMSEVTNMAPRVNGILDIPVCWERRPLRRILRTRVRLWAVGAWRAAKRWNAPMPNARRRSERVAAIQKRRYAWHGCQRRNSHRGCLPYPISGWFGG